MAGVYRPRYPERTVLYRVLFHHFERFLAEYEERFEKAYGYFRPIIIPDSPRGISRRIFGCGAGLQRARLYRESITMKALDKSAKPTPGRIPGKDKQIWYDALSSGYGGGLPRKRALLDLEAGKRVLGPAMFAAGGKK